MGKFLKAFVAILGVAMLVFVIYGRDKDQRTIVRNGEKIIVPRSFDLEREEIKILEREGIVKKNIYEKAIKNFFPVEIEKYKAEKTVFISEKKEIKEVVDRYVKVSEEKSSLYTFLFIILPVLIMLMMVWGNKLADYPKNFLILYYMSVLAGVIIALNGNMIYTVLWFWIVCTALSLFVCGPLGVVFSMLLVLPIMVKLNLLSQNYFLLQNVEEMSYGMWEYIYLFLTVSLLFFSIREIMTLTKKGES